MALADPRGGMRQALRTGLGAVWGPRLLALFGLASIVGGVLTADPMAGFPPGITPDGVQEQLAWRGAERLAFGEHCFAEPPGAWLKDIETPL